MKLNVHPGSLSLGVAAGLGAGVLVGLYLGNKKFQRQLDAEVASVKSHYNSRLKEVASAASAITTSDDEHEDTVGIVERDTRTAETVPDAEPEGETGEDIQDVVARRINYADARNQSQRSGRRSQIPVPVVIRDEENVTAGGGTSDLSNKQDPTAPYVISTAEFFEDHEDHKKLTITYYGEDDVLADDKDAPIRDVAGTVGENVFDKFGEQSDDENIVYVRNNRLQVDFEITRDLRAFTEVVLGYGNPKAGQKNAR